MEKSNSSASDLFARALRILGRRDHSEAELRQKLERFGFSAAVVDEVITRCYSYNYLNDERYAQTKSREMLRNGRGVGPRILLELRRRGITENLAQDALQTASEEIPPKEVFLQQLERRFSEFNYASADDRERRRVVSYFQRRGFDLGTIFSLLKEASQTDKK
jgi:regulatory protein